MQGLTCDAVLRRQIDRRLHRIGRIAAPVSQSVGAFVAHVGDREGERRRQ